MDISSEEYLESEKNSPVKREFVNGVVMAMAGASRIHNLIAVTLVNAFSTHLKGSGCMVFMADMKVKASHNDFDIYYYPDIMISCDKSSKNPYVEENPKLIVEVLSESTEPRDRLEKLAAYKKIPSLQEYILVAQDKMVVEIYRREAGGWGLERFQEGQTIQFKSLEMSLPIANVYEDVMGLPD